MEDSNNNLEKFFRDRFNQRIEPQDWNIPDNEVWDSIASEINKEDKRRRVGILPIILVGSSILLSLFMGIDNYNKSKSIASLQKELQECSNQIVISNDDDNTVKKDVKGEIKSQDDTPVAVKSHNQSIQLTSLDNSGNEKKISKNNRSSKASAPNIINTKNKEIELNNFQVMDLNEPLEVSNLASRIPAQMAYLPTLSNNFLFKRNSSLSLELPVVQENLPPKLKSNNGFSFGPSMQYIFWQDNSKGSFNNPLSELLEKEETSPSIALGLAVTKKLGNRLVLNTGLLYYQRNQTSTYLIELPYSVDEEINVGTEFENRFSHSLPTGLGDVNTSLVLSRSINSPVSNNEKVILDFSLQNHTKALALPLTLSYYLNKSGEGFYIQGGLFNEFIIQNEIREVNTESHHTFVKDKSIAVDYNKSQINKVNTSALIGIGYEKEILKGIGISLSTNYGFALTNTFATPNYQHKIDQLGLQMMVVKKI
ncbi:MAG TPA: hypothetical protein VK169_18970 [Saprospiraceae bacterium]|nr:hypothetical protein [Saprospiraceae bacterium]